MKIEIDTLALRNHLASNGFSAKQAEGFVQGLGKTDFNNLYSKDEINTMINDAFKQILDHYSKEWANERILFENRANQQLERYTQTEARFESRCDQIEERLDRRVRSSFHWTLTTVITVGIGLASLIHFTH